MPTTRLDLVLIETGPTMTAVQGARLLNAGLQPEDVGPEHLANGLHALVCAASDALGWALRLAAHRLRGPA